MKDKKNVQNSTIACAFLLATSPAWANTKIGDGQPPNADEKGQSKERIVPNIASKTSPRISIASIEIENADNKKVQNCAVPKDLEQPRLSLAFDPKKQQEVTLQFTMSKIPSTTSERVLLLLYSRCLSSEPQIKTPRSKNSLALDVRDMQVLGTYNVPALHVRSGAATSPTTQMNFEVNLETDKLAKQIEEGNDTFYFQVALLKKKDFDKQKHGRVNLSPLEVIHVTPKQCLDKKQLSDSIKAENARCKQLPTKTE
ncbi:hypothetical protein [Candidatus Parabeggiatoa sp. HSG14]|uniref:hypothetical protein n=1 Tax=Candidatus Parabeggiatoa sp. HSG14 TaxID=3055593 RepID=UPI0025A8FE46|nr:hypothetical protein [Thiotrichales bacterium HSG14]